jgi:lipopolysaccharide/colanic/teichoic acid biosynthesis glycosyltransferase
LAPSIAEGALITGSKSALADEVWSRRPELVLLRPEEQVRSGSEALRRGFNLAVAALTLILVAPLMVLIALAVKLSSRGPVIYRQLRVGIDRRRPGSSYSGRRTFDHGGQLFTMYKFRTMRHGEPGREVWASLRDARVTAVGAFLRKYRLDELPQLVNVIRGDMNLVGPRPEQPKIFLSLREQVDRYPLRQRALPGITGWSQINQSYDRCIDDVRRKVAFDIEYLSRASAVEDLKILARTVPVVLLRKGSW